MKKGNFSALFRGSLLLGLVTELTGYGCLLLCGYLLSGVLEAALAGQWDLTARQGLFTAGALALSLLPEFLYDSSGCRNTCFPCSAAAGSCGTPSVSVPACTVICWTGGFPPKTPEK